MSMFGKSFQFQQVFYRHHGFKFVLLLLNNTVIRVKMGVLSNRLNKLDSIEISGLVCVVICAFSSLTHSLSHSLSK